MDSIYRRVWKAIGGRVELNHEVVGSWRVMAEMMRLNITVIFFLYFYIFLLLHSSSVPISLSRVSVYKRNNSRKCAWQYLSSVKSMCTICIYLAWNHVYSRLSSYKQQNFSITYIMTQTSPHIRKKKGRNKQYLCYKSYRNQIFWLSQTSHYTYMMSQHW